LADQPETIEEVATAPEGMSNRPRAKIGWVFLGLWIAATAFALSFGGKHSSTVGNQFVMPLGMYIGYGFTGLLLGVGQWLLLRKIVNRSRWWVLVTTFAEAIAGPASLFVAFQLSFFSGGQLDLVAFSGIIRGGLTGFMQWTLFLGQFSYAGLWIPAAAASKCISVLIGVSLLGKFSDLTLAPNITNLVNGLLSGLAMLWLLHRPLIAIAPLPMNDINEAIEPTEQS
jgi:hypothetical protein